MTAEQLLKPKRACGPRLWLRALDACLGRPHVQREVESVEPDDETDILRAVYLAEDAHDAPDAAPVGVGPCGRCTTSCSGDVRLLPVGGGQLGPGHPCRPVHGGGATVVGELMAQPFRRVIREATVLSKRTEAEGVADSEGGTRGRRKRCPCSAGRGRCPLPRLCPHRPGPTDGPLVGTRSFR